MNKSIALFVGLGIGACCCVLVGRDWDSQNRDMLCGFAYGGLATYIALREWE